MPSLFSSLRSRPIPCSGSSPSARLLKVSKTLSMNYYISSPTKECCSVKELDLNIPTIVFIHPVFIASEIWHQQFMDLELRKFNLVAIDCRSHGGTIGDVPEGYDFIHAAEDVSKLMDLLKLPACHFVGVSLGSSIAIHLATFHANKVKSLFLISPLSAYEPEEVASGRKEIWEVWKEGKENQDDEVIKQACIGALQLGFNNAHSEVIDRLTDVALASCNKNWTSKDGIEAMRRMTVDLFLNRTPLALEDLKRINPAPLTMLHAGADCAYLDTHLLEKKKDFDAAELKVEFLSIKGAPHFAHVTHAHKINPLLNKFILDNSDASAAALRPPKAVVSPFQSVLYEYATTTDDEN